jgi:hypothetical protein
MSLAAFDGAAMASGSVFLDVPDRYQVVNLQKRLNSIVLFAAWDEIDRRIQARKTPLSRNARRAGTTGAFVAHHPITKPIQMLP